MRNAAGLRNAEICQEAYLVTASGLPDEASQGQTVVSVTNKITYQQAWFNKARTQKPQLFQQPDVLLDPTAKNQHCDFCQWEDYTAIDTFGRWPLQVTQCMNVQQHHNTAVRHVQD